jgi:hypothetical protein
MKRNSFIERYRPGDPMKNYIILWLFLALLSVYALVSCKPATAADERTLCHTVAADSISLEDVSGHGNYATTPTADVKQ